MLLDQQTCFLASVVFIDTLMSYLWKEGLGDGRHDPHVSDEKNLLLQVTMNS